MTSTNKHCDDLLWDYSSLFSCWPSRRKDVHVTLKSKTQGGERNRLTGTLSVANPFLKLKVRLYTPASEAFKAELPLSLCNPKTWIISKLRSRLRGFERQNTAVI